MSGTSRNTLGNLGSLRLCAFVSDVCQPSIMSGVHRQFRMSNDTWLGSSQAHSQNQHVRWNPDVAPRLNSDKLMLPPQSIHLPDWLLEISWYYDPNQHICQRGCRFFIPYQDKLMLLPPWTYLPERVPDLLSLIKRSWLMCHVGCGAMSGFGANMLVHVPTSAAFPIVALSHPQTFEPYLGISVVLTIILVSDLQLWELGSVMYFLLPKWLRDMHVCVRVCVLRLSISSHHNRLRYPKL